MPNDRAGAIRNLMLLTANTINILRNPDKIFLVSYNNAASGRMLYARLVYADNK